MSSETGLLAGDLQARIDALDVRRSFIVQAPAGSGKTELLIQRYLKLLAVVDKPEEILAITFTRKAAAEMQLRVLAALRAAASSGEDLPAHERLTRELAAQALQRDAALDWRVLESPRRLRIQTLDAFCSGLARSLPISSRLGASVRTIADAEMRSVYGAAAAATLDWLSSAQSSADPVQRVLRHLDNNTALYIAYLSRMLASRDQWLEIVGGSEDGSDGRAARATLERNIGDVITRQLVQLRGEISADNASELLRLAAHAADSFRQQGLTEHPLGRIDPVRGLPGSDPDDGDAWLALANLLLTQKGEWRKRQNKNDGFLTSDVEEKKSMLDLLAELSGQETLRVALHSVRDLPAPHYSDDQWEVLLALFRLLRIAAAELRRLFAEQGVTDYIEVALAARDALGSVDEPGELALVLDYSIRHILIDEMQDTSIGQYQLIESLLGGWQQGDGRTLFCVGDPMQSIYRFRDAEVGRFLQARNSGIAKVPLQSLVLRQNFRSGEELVHWFNTVFSQVMPLQEDLTTGAISYAESVPAEIHRGTGRYAVHPLFGVDQEGEADAGIAIIRRCLENNDGDTAVLVRSRTQLPLLLAKLRAAGLEYQAVEIDRLTDLPEVIDLLALTRALCHDGDRLAWLALLRGPWLGFTWNDLQALVVNDSSSTVLELAIDDTRLQNLTADGQVRLRRFLQTIDAHRRGHGNRALRDRVEMAWFALHGPELVQDSQQLENVYRYFEVLEKIETAGTILDVSELEARLDDERVSGMGTTDCRLQIMTMHRAKGLQFDHVVLYGLGRATASRKKAVLSWLNIPDGDGGNDMLISPVGARFELEQDSLHRYIEKTAREKEQIELDRLMYVACTRAKQSLQLIGHVAMNAEGDDFRPPTADSLLCRIWTAIEHEYRSAFAARPEAGTVAQSGIGRLMQPPLRRLSAAEQERCAPALPASRPAPAMPDPDRQVDYYWVGSAARHAGTIVHRWLQRLADGSISLDADRLDSLRAQNEKYALGLGVGRSNIEPVCERVADSLKGILSDPKGQWLISGPGHAELAISGVWEQRTQSVLIDRVRIDDDGVHWIVDYKTSAHEGGSLQQFLQQEEDRYRQQLQKYAALYQAWSGATVRAALYFPLLREFREVSLDGTAV